MAVVFPYDLLGLRKAQTFHLLAKQFGAQEFPVPSSWHFGIGQFDIRHALHDLHQLVAFPGVPSVPPAGKAQNYGLEHSGVFMGEICLGK